LIVCLIFLNVSFFSFASTSRNIQMFNASRKRLIPVEIYEPITQQKLQVVIINHGYTVKNTEYSFIANALVNKGYCVISIQHDLRSDDPLSGVGMVGDFFEARKPFWERGVKNILFVINELKRTKVDLDLSKVILIGHSHGGDIAMMFANLHPEMVSKVISMDSLRMPFPTDNGINVLRFASIDREPDEGVVPNSGVQVIKVKGAKHIDLCDRGSESIKIEVQQSIIEFLEK